MNSALLKRMGIKETQIVTPTKAVRGKKETSDSPKVRNVREQMNNTFQGFCTLISASYLEPIFKRDENKKILLDKDNKKAIEGYLQKNLNGQYVLEDNNDGTHTATKLNVYKETYLIDSETLNEVKVRNGNS